MTRRWFPTAVLISPFTSLINPGPFDDCTEFCLRNNIELHAKSVVRFMDDWEYFTCDFVLYIAVVLFQVNNVLISHKLLQAKSYEHRFW